MWAMNFQGNPKWIATVVENQLGPLTFVVRLKDGRTWKRHQDHLRERDQMRTTSSERNKSCPMLELGYSNYSADSRADTNTSGCQCVDGTESDGCEEIDPC